MRELATKFDPQADENLKQEPTSDLKEYFNVSPIPNYNGPFEFKSGTIGQTSQTR
jgi:hypothetical protein